MKKLRISNSNTNLNFQFSIPKQIPISRRVLILPGPLLFCASVAREPGPALANAVVPRCARAPAAQEESGSLVPALRAAEGYTGIQLHQRPAELLQRGERALARALYVEAHEDQVQGDVQVPAEAEEQ